MLANGNGPATVSTLKEAEIFAEAGVKDIIYAVGIAPQKLDRVLAIRKKGCDLAVILDSMAQAEAVIKASEKAADPLSVLIEIDCDGHRSGLAPDDQNIAELGKLLCAGEANLKGIITHAGGSYTAVGNEALAAFAEQERNAAVKAAGMLTKAGLPCPVVSVGSTPTSHFAKDLSGVTEVRAGVYVFFDLVMAGLGVCSKDDIAISVMTSVIGHQKEKGWITVDAGWMALSQDQGTARQAVNQGYGVVCDMEGRVMDDLIVSSANQEHGILSTRSGSRRRLPEIAIGTKLRILPIHACATATQFDGYQVIPVQKDGEIQYWPRFRGW